MVFRLLFGSPPRRLGLVSEDWLRTPGTTFSSKALPENTDMELVKCYGLVIHNTFIGIHYYVDRRTRAKQGFQFGPQPNVLDMIKDAE